MTTTYTVKARATAYGTTYDVLCNGAVCRADVGRDWAYKLAAEFAQRDAAWLDYETGCNRPAVLPDCLNAVQ